MPTRLRPVNGRRTPEAPAVGCASEREITAMSPTPASADGGLRARPEVSGVMVERDGKLIASLKCAAEPDGEMGPEWFEKFDVKPKGDADFFFPD